MRIKTVLEVIKKELRAILRDKKSLRMMLIFPIIIPIFLVIMSYYFESLLSDNDELERYNIGGNYEISEEESEILNSLGLDYYFYDTKDALENAYKNNNICAYVVKNIKTNEYAIYYEDNTGSNSVSSYIATYLDTYNRYLSEEYLVNNNIDPSSALDQIVYTYNPFENTSTSLIKELLSIAITYAVMATCLSCVYTATDTLSGEKERGTLETFLTFPIKTSEWVTGKFSAIFSAGFITSVISLIVSCVTLTILPNYFSVYEESTFVLSATNILLSLCLFIAITLVASGLCVAVAINCKSFKEAQSSLTPVSMLPMVSMFVTMFGTTTGTIFYLIPLAGPTTILFEIFSNSFSNRFVLISIASSIVYTVILLIYISNKSKSESVLFSLKQ